MKSNTVFTVPAPLNQWRQKNINPPLTSLPVCHGVPASIFEADPPPRRLVSHVIDAAGDAGVPRCHVHRRRLVMRHESVNDERLVFRTTLEVFYQAGTNFINVKNMNCSSVFLRVSLAFLVAA